ncbi:hypothetical protein D3C87_932450 [compost metagenome]
MVALEAAVEIQLPRSFGVTHANRAFVFRRERHAIALVWSVFADSRVNISVSGVDIETGERRAQVIQRVIDAGLDPLMASFATGDHRIVGLVAFVLVVEVDQERADFRAQRAVVIPRAEFPRTRLLRFYFAAGHPVGHLAVLHTAERAFGVGVQVPAVGQVIEHVQRWQCGVVFALVFDVGQVVGLLRLDHLVAHARCDRPFADVDAVVDEERIGLGAATGVAVVAAGGGRVLVAADRCAIAQFVTGLVDVAIADADFVAGRAEVETLGESGFQATHPILARRQRKEGALIEITAAQGLGEERVGSEFAAIFLIAIAEIEHRAAAPELVLRTRRLIRIGVVIGHVQTAGHVSLAFVILGHGVEAIGFVELVFALEDQVVDFSVAVFAPVAAARPGVEQRTAEAIGVSADGQQVGAGLEAVVARRWAGFRLEAALDRWLVRNRPGNEVDHAADVLRAVTHRAAAAHDVHGIHVAHADRRER